jgi:hypothetical protein
MHPNALDLQAFACGDDTPQVASHLSTCDACTDYVARASGLAKAPRTQPARELPVEGEKVATVTPIRSRRATLGLAIAPFAAAAAVLLWMGTKDPLPVATAIAPTPVTASAPPTALAMNQQPDPETTFKGGMQLAVVRERGGAQDRFTGAVRVRPGDRLRIEVALDRSETILGAVMGEDGSYVEIMPAGERAAGTHFSEKSTRVDEHPLRGTILVGSPEAVRLARTSHQTSGLRSIAIEWDATP